MRNYNIQRIMNTLININLYIDNDIFNLNDRINSETSFLNKKRNFDQSIFYNSFNNINPSKEVDFTLNKKIEIKNEINESIEEEGINNLNELSNQPIFNNNKISNFEKQKLIEIEKLFKKLININLK